MTATRVNLERYLNNYQDLQPYRGSLVYFRAELRPPGVINDPLAGWENFIPDDANIHPIPGNHSSMLKRPNVQALAQHLKQEMKKQHV
jgi:thioesterase domain-containing protein